MVAMSKRKHRDLSIHSESVHNNDSLHGLKTLYPKQSLPGLDPSVSEIISAYKNLDEENPSHTIYAETEDFNPIISVCMLMETSEILDTALLLVPNAQRNKKLRLLNKSKSMLIRITTMLARAFMFESSSSNSQLSSHRHNKISMNIESLMSIKSSMNVSPKIVIYFLLLNAVSELLNPDAHHFRLGSFLDLSHHWGHDVSVVPTSDILGLNNDTHNLGVPLLLTGYTFLHLPQTWLNPFVTNAAFSIPASDSLNVSNFHSGTTYISDSSSNGMTTVVSSAEPTLDQAIIGSVTPSNFSSVGQEISSLSIDHTTQYLGSLGSTLSNGLEYNTVSSFVQTQALTLSSVTAVLALTSETVLPHSTIVNNVTTVVDPLLTTDLSNSPLSNLITNTDHTQSLALPVNDVLDNTQVNAISTVADNTVTTAASLVPIAAVTSTLTSEPAAPLILTAMLNINSVVDYTHTTTLPVNDFLSNAPVALVNTTASLTPTATVAPVLISESTTPLISTTTTTINSVVDNTHTTSLPANDVLSNAPAAVTNTATQAPATTAPVSTPVAAAFSEVLATQHTVTNESLDHHYIQTQMHIVSH